MASEFRRITRAQWEAKPRDYRGRYGPLCGFPELVGKHNWLSMDEQTGATILEPVEIVGMRCNPISESWGKYRRPPAWRGHRTGSSRPHN